MGQFRTRQTRSPIPQPKWQGLPQAPSKGKRNWVGPGRYLCLGKLARPWTYAHPQAGGTPEVGRSPQGGSKAWGRGMAQHHQACRQHRHRPHGASRRGWHRRGLVQLLRTGRRTVNLGNSYYVHMVVLCCSLSNTLGIPLSPGCWGPDLKSLRSTRLVFDIYSCVKHQLSIILN